MAGAFLLSSLVLVVAQWPSSCQGRSTGVTNATHAISGTGGSSWPAVDNNATTSARNGTDCVAYWPRNSSDICYREECLTSNGRTVLLSEVGDGYEQCQSIVERQLITVAEAGCPAGQVPGPPIELKVNVIANDYDVGFHIVLTWYQPTDPTNLIGFRIQITLKVGTVLESFYLPKVTTKFPNTPGLHWARIMSNSTLCEGCVVSRMLVLGQLIGSLDPYEMLIKVTSLPLPDNHSDTGQYRTQPLLIPSCEAMECLPSMRFALPIADPSCKFARSPGLKRVKRLCKCPFGDYIRVTSIAVAGVSSNTTSVTVQWLWHKPWIPNETVIHSLLIRAKIGGSENVFSDQIKLDVTRPWHLEEHTFELDVRVEHGDVLVAVGELSEHNDYTQLDLQRFTYTTPTHIIPTTEPPLPTTSANSLLPDVAQVGKSSLVLGAAGVGLSVLVFAGVVVLVFWNMGRRNSNIPPTFADGRWTSTTSMAAHSPPLQNDTQRQVYISYSRFTDTTSTRAWALCQCLTASGVNAVLAEHHLVEMEGVGPESWIEEQIARSAFVLVLLDSSYPMNLTAVARHRLLSGCPGSVQHAITECTLLEGEMYSGRSNFVIPVFIGPAEQVGDSIPQVLQHKTVHRLPIDFDGTNADFRRLCCHILEQPQQIRHIVTSM